MMDEVSGDSMKSRAISRIKSLMMMMKMFLETSVEYRHVTRLIAREDFIKFSSRERSRTCINGDYSPGDTMIPQASNFEHLSNITDVSRA
jgi:hypothetical protein